MLGKHVKKQTFVNSLNEFSHYENEFTLNIDKQYHIIVHTSNYVSILDPISGCVKQMSLLQHCVN